MSKIKNQAYVYDASRKPTVQSCQKIKQVKMTQNMLTLQLCPTVLASTLGQDTAILTVVSCLHPAPPKR